MRLTRAGVLTVAILASVAAWPQDEPLPAVDHSLHPLVEHPASEPVPFVRVHMQADSMDGFNLYLETRNFRFAPELVDTVNVTNAGHAHLYLNGEKVARMYSPWHHVSAKSLRDGINRLEVELSANDHSTWAVAGQPIGADILINGGLRDGDPIVRSEVGYTLDWEWGRAEALSTGGWSTVTDLGYRVEVTAGAVVTRNLELVPCHVPLPIPRAALPWSLFAPVPVAAGHSSLAPNESKISTSYSEDLAAPKARFLETKVVTDPEYCRAHYLIAREKGTALGAEALSVVGTWSRAPDWVATPFRLKSASAYGDFRELRDAGGSVARRTIVGGIQVTVKRSLSTMLDGIDFRTGVSEDHGALVMRRVVSETKIYVGESQFRARN